jgi:flagellar biosynthesis protein FlhA
MASSTPASSGLKRFFGQGDLWLIFGLFGTILLLIFPVPPQLLDGLLAMSIALSLLTMLVILYLKEPSEFSGFPTLLLVITLFRLALNVASTRLILLDGYAGEIIAAFGSFVVRGNFVVGLVVFLILVLINFVVITKGAGRIAEVAARFTLDAMPGKQMAIDADLSAGLINEDEARKRRKNLEDESAFYAELNAGVINESEARERRKKVEQEADFYGAMDGASKFVRGDAIAAILITLVNVIGGFAIGIAQMGMTVSESLSLFTLLSIGDGLVSQIPSLITSVAAGILVTRAAAKNDLGQELGSQLLFYPRALNMLIIMLVVMAFLPGLPMMPFLVLAGITWFVLRVLKQHAPQLTAAAEARGTAGAVGLKGGAAGGTGGAGAAPAGGERLEGMLSLETLQIELGYGLVSLADQRKGGDLLERITGIRRNFAQEMGVIIPPVRLRDNLQLGANEYRFLLKGNQVAKGEILPGYWLAMNATSSKTVLKGVPTVEPVFQLPATWVTDAERKHAEVGGFTVVDAPSVLVTHLSESIKRNAHEILTRQDVQTLLDNLKQTHATVINELIPGLLSVGQIQRVLQNLLSEGVSIRNLAGILEKVSDYAATTKNPDELSEHARRALGAQLARPYQQDNGAIKAITLDPKLEQALTQGVRQSANEVALTMEPRVARHLIERLSKLIQQMISNGLPPVGAVLAADPAWFPALL